MLFNSYVFLFSFLPVVLLGWWTLPGKNARLLFLTATSCLFYGWWDFRFVPLMLISSFADYFAGARVHAARTQRAKKTWLVLLLAFNLGILGYFKYTNFFLDSLEGLGRQLGADVHLSALEVILPIGISFYTFNSISYTIDVYRGHLRPVKSALQFSAFVTMFPHLVAGPIVRYSDMNDQFSSLPPRPAADHWVLGTWFLVLGLAKKMLLADVIANNFVTPLFENVDGLQFVGSWLAALGYTLQIYFDFSGYSDMAVGLAFYLGLRFPKNFDSPYKAHNVSEFWRRWHMSLSFWLRDYLFIPLGGSRSSKLLTARNLAVTMLLGGLWHGAAWTFAVWGIYHGALLALHTSAKAMGWVPRSAALSVTITFLAVVVGWVFFRAATLSEAASVLQAMGGLRGLEAPSALSALLLQKAMLVFVFGFVAVFLAPNTWEIRKRRSWSAAAVLAGVMFVCVLRLGEESPFLYFQF